MLTSKGGSYKAQYFNNYKTYTLQNIPWGNFVQNISSRINTPTQIIDETGVKPDVKIDVSIDFEWNNLAAVNKSLQPYGLKIIEEQRLLDCIVLNDVK